MRPPKGASAPEQYITVKLLLWANWGALGPAIRVYLRPTRLR